MGNVVALFGGSGRGMSLRYPCFVGGGAFAGVFWNKKGTRLLNT
jgi:hypothetical protein